MYRTINTVKMFMWTNQRTHIANLWTRIIEASSRWQELQFIQSGTKDIVGSGANRKTSQHTRAYDWTKGTWQSSPFSLGFGRQGSSRRNVTRSTSAMTTSWPEASVSHPEPPSRCRSVPSGSAIDPHVKCSQQTHAGDLLTSTLARLW